METDTHQSLAFQTKESQTTGTCTQIKGLNVSARISDTTFVACGKAAYGYRTAHIELLVPTMQTRWFGVNWSFEAPV